MRISRGAPAAPALGGDRGDAGRESLADRKLSKLDEETREQLHAALAEHTGLSDTDREALALKLAPVFAGFGLTRAQEGAVWDALAVATPRPR